MPTGLFWQAIYWLATPTLAALAVVLLMRSLHRQFPLFFTYVLVAFIGDVVRFVTYHGSFKLYAYTYWISELVNTILSLLATYELFLRRLFPQFQKIGFYRGLFSVAAVVIAILSIFTSLHSIPVERLLDILHGLDALRVAVLFLFVGVMVFMGRRWERFEFGIALGFGIQAAGFLSAFAIWAAQRKTMAAVAGLLTTLGYDLAALIWLSFFLGRRKGTPAFLVTPELVQQAREWEKTLKDSVQGKKPSA